MLSPEFLSKLGQLQIYCQQPFRGKLRGDRRSLNRGSGVEFADYRLYEPGDDLRYLDWNVYARLEKLFIKLYQTDANLSVSILMDTSRSMEFGEPTKLLYAKQLTAALGYIALTNSDTVSLYSIAERLTSVMSPIYGKSQYMRFEKILSSIESNGETYLTECLQHLTAYQPQAGVAIIISDFLDTEGYTEGVNSLIGRGYVLLFIHVQCPEEIAPPPFGEWRLEDAETGETKEITINEESILTYQEQHRQFCIDLERFCRERGISYVRVNTDVSIESVFVKDMLSTGFIQHRY